MKYARYPLTVEALTDTKWTKRVEIRAKIKFTASNVPHNGNGKTNNIGNNGTSTLANYDDLMQTTIFRKVFLIMYSDLRRV